jgi:hypothetical protein
MRNQIFWSTLVIFNLISATYHWDCNADFLGNLNLFLAGVCLYEARPVMEEAK